MAQGKAVALPQRALDLLRWTLEYHRRTGYMPSVREQAAAFGMASTNGVRYYLRMLDDCGYLIRAGTPGMARTLRVTPAGQRAAAP